MLALEAEQQHPQPVEQRGAVDLVRGLLDLELLDRAGNRFKPGEMSAQRLRIERAQPPVVPRHSGLGCGGGIEMPPEIEKGAAERVGERHCYPDPLSSL